MTPQIAITMGDPAGIGPEIILKAWQQDADLLRCAVVVGDMACMQRARAVLPSGVPELVQVPDWQAARAVAQTGRIPVVQVQLPQTGNALPDFGQVSAQAGSMAAACITQATQAVLRQEVAAMATAPVHKEALALAGVPYPGHTEMLQALAAQHMGVAVHEMPVRMMLANPELKTVLNSIHVSLRDAIDQVQIKSLLQTLSITNDFFHRVLRHRKPKIAVAGLNPHAGEGGLFGREELDAIIPAIHLAQAQGMDVQGPFPPDTVFMQARAAAEQEPPFADAVIAMYHDQGLIPVKYMGVEHGVNVTLGLPLVRTSPDHGTAFNLAGTGQADATSMLAAIRMAQQMVVKSA